MPALRPDRLAASRRVTLAVRRAFRGREAQDSRGVRRRVADRLRFHSSEHGDYPNELPSSDPVGFGKLASVHPGPDRAGRCSWL